MNPLEPFPREFELNSDDMPGIGANLRVTMCLEQGARQYMEDFTQVYFQETEDKQEVSFGFFAVFDGHGGEEAARYAKTHLLKEIVKQPDFWTGDDEDIKKAIKDGFSSCHNGMWNERGKWKRTNTGFPSTAGTTASIAVLFQNKLFVAHVGDSGVILGQEDGPRGDKKITAIKLTKDHKPECPVERKRIESMGGSVMTKSGVNRVVWRRPKKGHIGAVRRSTEIDNIPFLAVARSLGDLWSYDCSSDAYAVSPDPDISMVKINPDKHFCIILASDGFLNMVTAQEAVEMVDALEKETYKRVVYQHKQTSESFWINPATTLVNTALHRWQARSLRADNTSCVVVMIDPLGKTRKTILREARMDNLRKIESEISGKQLVRMGSVSGLDEISESGEKILYARPYTPVHPKHIAAQRKVFTLPYHLLHRHTKPKVAAPKTAPPAVNTTNKETDLGQSPVLKDKDGSSSAKGDMKLKFFKPPPHLLNRWSRAYTSPAVSCDDRQRGDGDKSKENEGNVPNSHHSGHHPDTSLTLKPHNCVKTDIRVTGMKMKNKKLNHGAPYTLNPGKTRSAPALNSPKAGENSKCSKSDLNISSTNIAKNNLRNTEKLENVTDVQNKNSSGVSPSRRSPRIPFREPVMTRSSTKPRTRSVTNKRKLSNEIKAGVKRLNVHMTLFKRKQEKNKRNTVIANTQRRTRLRSQKC